MRALPLWSLAKPWSPDEWAVIVDAALQASSLRSQARQHRRSRSLSQRTGSGDPCGNLEDAMRLEWRARGLEARIRAKADVLGRDLAADAVDKFAGVSFQGPEP